jgi:3-oxoacyl-[acyl-carrier protein] reductase
MTVKLDNRVAIVTGGANGIGRATTMAFIEAGAAVAIWDVADDAGNALVAEIRDKGGKAAFFKVNVADQESVEAAANAVAEQFGRIDILINNAGITRDAQFLKFKEGKVAGKMSKADWDAVIGVNLTGVFNCTQAVAPYMLAQGWGRVVNATSIAGQSGNFGQTNYSASKAGVIGLTKVWARELGRRGVNVNAIAPGFIATDMTKAIPDQVQAGMMEHIPLGRPGQPEGVARAYVFLASEQASYINGSVLNVDGGFVLGT